MLSDSGSRVRAVAAARLNRHDQPRQASNWMTRIWEQPNTRVLWLDEGKALVNGARSSSTDTPSHTGPHLVLKAPHGQLPASAVYLGEVDVAEVEDFPEPTGPAHVVAVPVKSSAPGKGDLRQPPTATWESLRSVGSILPAVEAELLSQATALTAWHASSAFCPACGGATEVRHSGWARSCHRCEALHFPRTDPAVITAVIGPDDCLLLGSAVRWDSRRYSTFAGFVEAGESLEGAIVREVKEEAGVDVDRVEYISSQAWPFPRSLMLGFLAHTSDVFATADLEEIREVRWFTRDKLCDDVISGAVTLPPRSSISHALIARWFGGPLPDRLERGL
ncbi:NAD(+) diphosphatase [Nesterenkonia sphaerica]|uniref:NAD(+) diphosphatase n=1 Tax=Nesterenkonia sphaerica TaxID=1804988 RepID=A0A5R8ZW19_9MICC|nr:NAD(+) diphosphatase [Nesterenkonia sphaerica]TLP70598.1 NAD(+) diphosphatase [Nesterenkonia sphaerica]